MPLCYHITKSNIVNTHEENGMHILVVEDERALCDTIARSLRRLAYSVDCCYDGQSAGDARR